VNASLVLLIHAEGRGGGGGVSVRVPERTTIFASPQIQNRRQCYLYCTEERFEDHKLVCDCQLEAIVSGCCGLDEEPRTEVAVASLLRMFTTASGHC